MISLQLAEIRQKPMGRPVNSFWQQAEAGSWFQITTAKGGVSTPPFSFQKSGTRNASSHCKRFLWYRLLAVWILAIGIGKVASGQVPAQTVPAFEFIRLDDSPFTQKDIPAGKMVFFVFFDSDCEHCQQAVRNINQQYKAFEKTAIYFVSLDPPEKMIRFMSIFGPELKKQKNVQLLHDKRNLFIARFNPRKYPGMFLYSPEGRLIDYEDNEGTVFRLAHVASQGSLAGLALH
jgi:peroxiredoxin